MYINYAKEGVDINEERKTDYDIKSFISKLITIA